MTRIVNLVDEGQLALVPRIIPDPNLPAHQVIDPSRGTAQIFNEEGALMGTRWVWMCSYCGFQERCSEDHAHEEEARRLALLERSVEIAQASG